MPIRMPDLTVAVCALCMLPWLIGCKRKAIDPAPVPVALSDPHVWDHLITPQVPFRLSASDWHQLSAALCGPMESLLYEVTVSPAGTVQSAHIIPEEVSCQAGELADATPQLVRVHLKEADALVYAMRFRPWLVQGRTATVVFHTSLPLAPPEQYGSPRPFPESIDPSTVTIGLERRGCEGLCPAYSVLLKADGTVLYDGGAYVAISGHRVAYVSPAKVSALLEQFRSANFLSALPSYSGTYDGGDAVIQLWMNGTLYQVEDESGLMVGLPTSILALEQAVDQASGSARWVIGGVDPNVALDMRDWK